MIISRKIIAQLSTNLTGGAMAMNLITHVIAVVMGAFIGYTIFQAGV